MANKHGYLEKKERPPTKGKTKSYWCVTTKGLEYGKNITSTTNPHQTQPHWFDYKFEELLQIITR